MDHTYAPEGQKISTAENRDALANRAALIHAMETGKILEAVALLCDVNYNLSVDLGCMRGIIPREESALPADGIDVKDIAVITRVGKAVCFKVIGLQTDENGKEYAVLSRRAAQADCKANFLDKLRPGDILPAKVTHLEHFGAFVDIGCGCISLISIDCISVSRISHPRDRFFPGMQIYAVVKSIDRESGRIYVSHKELLGTWEENAARFSIGQTVTGIVRSIEEYGIFVELTPNLAGLAEYREDISVGQSAAVYIKNIIADRMKIKLVLIDSHKGETLEKRPEYYIRSGHIDRWVYSPPSSEKLIETLFTESSDSAGE